MRPSKALVKARPAPPKAKAVGQDDDWGDPEESFGPKIPLRVGPHGTHNSKPFPLLDITIKGTVTQQEEPDCFVSRTVITYTFQNTFREAELWFPIQELTGAMSVTMTVNGQETHSKTVYEQAPNGTPPHLKMPPQGIPGDAGKLKDGHIKYNYWRGEALEDMEPDSRTTLVVDYEFLVPPVGVQLHSWILPLSLMPKAPSSLQLTLHPLKPITTIECSNLPKALRVARQERTVEVSLGNLEALDLADHYLLIKFSTRAEPFDPTYWLLVAFVGIAVALLALFGFLLFNPSALRLPQLLGLTR
eukprot:EG_transcript_16856